jgi:uncharacterized protein (UPF0333 family)
MHTRKAQASMEYLLSVSALLILLFVMYGLSVDMQIRQQLINTEFESIIAAHRVSTAMDYIAILGNVSYTKFRVNTHPDHYVLVNGSHIVTFALSNHSVTIVSSIANLSSGSVLMRTNNEFVVRNDGDVDVFTD